MQILLINDIRNIPFLNNLIAFYAEAYLLDVVPRYDIHGKKISKPGKTVYVQACYIVSEQSTRDREFGLLEKIRDNHPKYVISATPLLTQRDENGITHLSLRKFLKAGRQSQDQFF